jgi:hypothetical protein
MHRTKIKIKKYCSHFVDYAPCFGTSQVRSSGSLLSCYQTAFKWSVLGEMNFSISVFIFIMKCEF